MKVRINRFVGGISAGVGKVVNKSVGVPLKGLAEKATATLAASKKPGSLKDKFNPADKLSLNKKGPINRLKRKTGLF